MNDQTVGAANNPAEELRRKIDESWRQIDDIKREILPLIFGDADPAQAAEAWKKLEEAIFKYWDLVKEYVVNFYDPTTDETLYFRTFDHYLAFRQQVETVSDSVVKTAQDAIIEIQLLMINKAFEAYSKSPDVVNLFNLLSLVVEAQREGVGAGESIQFPPEVQAVIDREAKKRQEQPLEKQLWDDHFIKDIIRALKDMRSLQSDPVKRMMREQQAAEFQRGKK
jgi:hypothetical protein